jgi:hypothetical protein
MKQVIGGWRMADRDNQPRAARKQQHETPSAIRYPLVTDFDDV